MMKLKNFPRFNLALLPTPLHKLENLSHYLRVNVYIKRDDLTGFAFGGNKIRKLEFLLADAKKKEVDIILTCGALQSNHCRLTAGLASRVGFETHLIVGDKQKPSKFTGNLLLDRLFNAKFHYIEMDGFEADKLQEEMERVAEKLEKKGKKTYLIPTGGSVPLGSLGYVLAAKEIKQQSQELGIKFSHIFHASSSGGTQAGLEVGERIFKLNSKIVGIGVRKAPLGEIEDTIFKLCQGIANLLKTKPIEKKEIKVDFNYVGKGYGIKTKVGVEAVKLLATKEAILLDYVYTGKAMAGLIDYARKGKFSARDNVLFLHTGGNVELFA